jgi:hypothetical protein
LALWIPLLFISINGKFFKNVFLGCLGFLCGTIKGMNIHYWLLWCVEQIGSSDNVSDLYLECLWFKSRVGHWLSWLGFFVGFFSPSRKMPG